MNNPSTHTSGNGKNSAAPRQPDVNGNTKVKEPAAPERNAPVTAKPEPKEPAQQQAAQIKPDDVIKADADPVPPKPDANPAPRAEQDNDRGLRQ
jgi:hypothetical protein